MSDVVVLGGGPAGTSAAALLASWGHHVRLITRPRGEARLAVSLPPSCAKLFDVIGVRKLIDDAGFIRSTGNTVWWGTREPRVERFADGGRGWQVDAHALESVMLDRAIESGARVDSEPAGAEAAALHTTFTIDCTGRSGVLAKEKGVREYDEGPRTIALVSSWTRDGAWPVPDDSHTLIETYESGWAWSVPTAAGSRHVAVMVDPQRSGLARGRGAREIYLAEIAKTNIFRALTAPATLSAGPWGWDASPYRSTRYAGEDWLLAGDAASFIDPLSSAGVKKALASAWLAAVAAHTALVNPPMKHDALEFFSDREREIEAHYASEARAFLGAAASGHAHAFWMDRIDENDAGIEAGQATAALKGRPAGAALEALRAADRIALRRPPSLRVEPRPAVSGHEIVRLPHIIPEGRPSGVRHVRNVDLMLLLELAPRHSQVPDLFHAYCRERATVPLPDFLYALSTAVASGWLVSQ